MYSELRLAVRSLLRSPGFTLTALAALALGIGANSAVFGLVNQLLVNPPGMADPERVVAIRAAYDKLGMKSISISGPDFADVRDSDATFEAAAVMSGGDLNYTGGGEAERLIGASVSVRWFDVFGAKPSLGRVFLPEEDREHASPVAILAHASWQRLFGGDPGVVGRTIELNRKPYRIVGVMPAEFRWPRNVEIWVPLQLPAAEFTPDYRFNEHLVGFARTKPGVTVEEADAVVRVLADRLRQGQDELATFARDAGWRMFAVSARDFIAGETRTPLLVLFGAVAFVLLIACANIAGLMVARGASQSRDTAVRAALGASRAQLIRRTLVESLVLSCAGALLGLALAYAGMRGLVLLAPERMIPGFLPRLDAMMLAFTAVATVVSALLFGLVPAWHSARSAPFEALKASGRTAGAARSHRLRSGLVIAETALALVLLVGAGLFIRSLARLQQVDPGFDASSVMTAGVALPEASYAEPARRAAFFHMVVENLAATPGVTAAGVGFPLPFSGGNSSGSFGIEGRTPNPGEPGPHADQRSVTPGYFAALRIPLVAGRLFTEQEQMDGLRVAVIDDALARQYWPGESPLGKRIRGGGPNAPWSTIVGIVRHVKHSSLAEDSGKGVCYYSMYQRPMPMGGIVARAEGDAAPLAAAIRSAVRRADAGQPVSRLRSMEDMVATSMSASRFVTRLVAFFALVALGLAALGLFGVISYMTTQRTQEIGLRMALGAERWSVRLMVVRQGVRLAAIGVAMGLAAALVLARLIASQLYDAAPVDVPTFTVTVAILLLAAVAASYLPARRASRIDPLVALRDE
ncbi:MAG TPA: ABC transporter permease [Vicinamibacterales bacterium]|nr:ABC transporter permease [Vicinamibacterales bacterium]